MTRVCCFVCTTVLSLCLALDAEAQQGTSLVPQGQGAQADGLAGFNEDIDLRLAGYELQPETHPDVTEDTLIFSPLAPVAVEAQPVKLPEDQQPD